MIRALIQVLLGGRPMTHVEYRFTDKVSGKPVHLFRDTLGREWLAEHAWARFRVKPGGEA